MSNVQRIPTGREHGMSRVVQIKTVLEFLCADEGDRRQAVAAFCLLHQLDMEEVISVFTEDGEL